MPVGGPEGVKATHASSSADASVCNLHRNRWNASKPFLKVTHRPELPNQRSFNRSQRRGE
jgi:hypothetical protein